MRSLRYLENTRKHFWNDDYLEFLVSYVWKIDKPINIIDFGCGYGFLGLKLLPILPEGSTYTGIDNSEELINNAKKIFSVRGITGEFIIEDLLTYEPLEKYDLAICQSVLRHIPKYSWC